MKKVPKGKVGKNVVHWWCMHVVVLQIVEAGHRVMCACMCEHHVVHCASSVMHVVVPQPHEEVEAGHRVMCVHV